MSGKPHVSFAVRLAGASDIAHAGMTHLDRAEHEALIEGLRRLGPTECRALVPDPNVAHLLESAAGKLLMHLETPRAAESVIPVEPLAPSITGIQSATHELCRVNDAFEELQDPTPEQAAQYYADRGEAMRVLNIHRGNLFEAVITAVVAQSRADRSHTLVIE
jgi:hypothetical protein